MVMFTVPFGTLPNLSDGEFCPLLKDNTTHSNIRGSVEFNGPTVSSKDSLFRRAQGTNSPEPLLATVLSTGTRHSTMYKWLSVSTIPKGQDSVGFSPFAETTCTVVSGGTAAGEREETKMWHWYKAEEALYYDIQQQRHIVKIIQG